MLGGDRGKLTTSRFCFQYLYSHVEPIWLLSPRTSYCSALLLEAIAIAPKVQNARRCHGLLGSSDHWQLEEGVVGQV